MPRITKKSTQKKRMLERERLEENILEAATSVFRKNGFPNSTVDEIASAAGVAVGTIYNIFENKDFLYVKVAEKIAALLIGETEKALQSDEYPESVLKGLIASRIENYETHRLFFVLFSCEKRTGSYPDPAKISPKAVHLYYSYLDICGKIFEAGISKGLFRPGNPLYGALTLEGSIDAFMGYFSSPSGNQRIKKNFADFCRNFLSSFKFPEMQLPSEAEQKKQTQEKREIYITRYDYERLSELIKVAEIFGGPDPAADIRRLEKELASGVIMDSRAIPANVVTMNSKVLIWDNVAGSSSEKRLVFPADSDKNSANISVLSPMGTALLGQKESCSFTIQTEDGDKLYLIKKITYQPESSGDYHL